MSDVSVAQASTRASASTEFDDLAHAQVLGALAAGRPFWSFRGSRGW